MFEALNKKLQRTTQTWEGFGFDCIRASVAFGAAYGLTTLCESYAPPVVTGLVAANAPALLTYFSGFAEGAWLKPQSAQSARVGIAERGDDKENSPLMDLAQNKEGFEDATTTSCCTTSCVRQSLARKVSGAILPGLSGAAAAGAAVTLFGATPETGNTVASGVASIMGMFTRRTDQQHDNLQGEKKKLEAELAQYKPATIAPV